MIASESISDNLYCVNYQVPKYSHNTVADFPSENVQIHPKMESFAPRKAWAECSHSAEIRNSQSLLQSHSGASEFGVSGGNSEVPQKSAECTAPLPKIKQVSDVGFWSTRGIVVIARGKTENIV